MWGPDIQIDKDNELSLVPDFIKFCQNAHRTPKLVKMMLERELACRALLDGTSGCLIFTSALDEEDYWLGCKMFEIIFMKCRKCCSTDTRLGKGYRKSIVKICCPYCMRSRTVDLNNPRADLPVLETIIEEDETTSEEE